MMKMFFGGDDGSPSATVSDHWPARLKTLQRGATLALKNFQRLSAQERAEHDDLLITMRALADPKKTAATYFAMSQAMSEHGGRPLSDEELVGAKEISEGLQQERLNDEERKPLNASPGDARKRGIARLLSRFGPTPEPTGSWNSDPAIVKALLCRAANPMKIGDHGAERQGRDGALWRGFDRIVSYHQIGEQAQRYTVFRLQLRCPVLAQWRRNGLKFQPLGISTRAEAE